MTMVIVLSMHRSGSSLLTGLLSRCGLNPGQEEELISGRVDNPKGFYERNDVVKLNKRILDQGQFSTDVPNLDFDIEAVSQDISDDVGAVVSRLYASKVSLIKDPRLCITLPVWLKYIESPVIIYLTRSPKAVAKSLEKRSGIPEQIGGGIWEYYNHKARLHIKGLPVYQISFERLVLEPERELKLLIDWLKRQGLNVEMISGAELGDFFDPDLVHHRPEEAESDNFSRLYGARSSDEERFDDVPALNERSHLLLSVWAEIEKLQYMPYGARQTLRASKEMTHKLNGQLNSCMKNMKSLETKCIKLEEELEVRMARVKLMEAQMDTAGKLLAKYTRSRPARMIGAITQFLKEIKAKEKGVDPLAELRAILSKQYESDR